MMSVIPGGQVSVVPLRLHYDVDLLLQPQFLPSCGHLHVNPETPRAEHPDRRQMTSSPSTLPSSSMGIIPEDRLHYSSELSAIVFSMSRPAPRTECLFMFGLSAIAEKA